MASVAAPAAPPPELSADVLRLIYDQLGAGRACRTRAAMRLACHACARFPLEAVEGRAAALAPLIRRRRELARTRVSGGHSEPCTVVTLPITASRHYVMFYHSEQGRNPRVLVMHTTAAA